MNEMTPAEAFGILSQVVSKFQATGEQHAIIAQALRTLHGLLPKEEKK